MTSRLSRLMGSEQARYLLVGAWNTLVGYLLFAGLVTWLADDVHYVLLLLVAHVLSVFQAFVLYRRFVFRVTGRFWGDLLRFWSVYAAALAVNVVALPLLVDVAGAPVLPAQAGFVVATIVTTYLVNRRFSFARPFPGQSENSTTAT